MANDAGSIVCFLERAEELRPIRRERSTMPIKCPDCRQRVVQARNREGPNFCPQCQRLFEVSGEPQMPPWILGVLVILVANWQIISR